MKILILLLIISCGKSTLEIEDSVQKVEGTTTSEVVIKFEPLIQINKLCNDLYIQSEFYSEELYLQKVAECTFEKLSVISFDLVSDFDSDLCATDETYDNLTPEEKLQVDQICNVL